MGGAFPESDHGSCDNARLALFSRLDRRHLGLVDNQGVVACVTRGRSRNGRVNSVIRRLAVVSLVTGSSIDLVWVRTTLQLADALSRRV